MLEVHIDYKIRKALLRADMQLRQYTSFMITDDLKGYL